MVYYILTAPVIRECMTVTALFPPKNLFDILNLMREDIILVDELNNQVGVGGKLEVHKIGQLHRAFSIYTFNSKGELLLQKRATGKYHSGGLWTNTCCGHPRNTEKVLDGANRRLMEEFGFNAPLREISNFRYKVELDNHLTENEFLHVFVSNKNAAPKPNPEEIEDWEWMPFMEVKTDIKIHPENYTKWFCLIMQDEKKLAELTKASEYGIQ